MAYLASHLVSRSLAILGFCRLDEKVSGSELAGTKIITVKSPNGKPTKPIVAGVWYGNAYFLTSGWGQSQSIDGVMQQLLCCCNCLRYAEELPQSHL